MFSSPVVAPAVVPSAAIPRLGVVTGVQHERVIAFLILSVLVSATVVAGIAGARAGPHIRAFIPICATIWASADLLTAFLLLSQFYVDGKISRAVIAAAYAGTGLISIGYLAYFPGVFSTTTPDLGTMQVSAWLWPLWHITFPLTLAFATTLGGGERRSLPRRRIAGWLTATVIGTALVSAAMVATVAIVRYRLPAVTDLDGHFTPFYAHIVAPVVVAANAFALVVVGFGTVRRQESGLQRWLALAIAAALLDAIINAFAPGRYSLAWYVGKVQSVITATVVLSMFLAEIATLYRRLYDVASRDALTGLKNRRALDDDLSEMAMPQSLAVLMVDVDEFKRYNDTYGHAAGDDALRRVAGVMQRVIRQPRDTVARYGGEEFVVVLPDATLSVARLVAERVREAVSSLELPHAASAAKHVTVSVGVGFAPDAHALPVERLFAIADRALYAAKDAGRDRVEVGQT